MANFFTMEIRAKLTISAWLVDTIKKVQRGEQRYALFTGESHEVLIHDGEAKVSSEFSPATPNPLLMPLSEFLDVAERWHTFIGTPSADRRKG